MLTWLALFNVNYVLLVNTKRVLVKVLVQLALLAIIVKLVKQLKYLVHKVFIKRICYNHLAFYALVVLTNIKKVKLLVLHAQREVLVPKDLFIQFLANLANIPSQVVSIVLYVIMDNIKCFKVLLNAIIVHLDISVLIKHLSLIFALVELTKIVLK